MTHTELQSELKKRVKKRRTVEAVLSGVFSVVAIVFTVLYYSSMEVEETALGYITHTSVTYNYDLAWGILVGALAATPSIIVLICDLIFCKVVTLEVKGDFITFYRGLSHSRIYVNGKLEANCSFDYHMEAPLSDGTTVNVALGKWSAHLTFSNGHPPIDV